MIMTEAMHVRTDFELYLSYSIALLQHCMETEIQLRSVNEPYGWRGFVGMVPGALHKRAIHGFGRISTCGCYCFSTLSRG